MRLVDVKVLEMQIKESFKENPVVMGILLRWLRKQPTVDAVPVGRCRNCTQFMEYSRDCAKPVEWADGYCYIRLVSSGNKQYAACKYDDFCSHGERRSDEG